MNCAQSTHNGESFSGLPDRQHNINILPLMCRSEHRLPAKVYACGNSALLPLGGAVVLVMMSLSVCGCAILWPGAGPKAEEVSAQSSEATKTTAESTSPPAGSSGPDKLSEDLQQLGSVWDQQTKEKLLDDLRQTDPSLWPALIQQYKAVANYRRNATSEDASRKTVPSQSAQHNTSNLAETPQHGDSPAGDSGRRQVAGRGSGAQEGGVASGANPTRLPVPSDTILPPELTPHGQYATTGYPPLGRSSDSGCRTGQCVPASKTVAGETGIGESEALTAGENKEHGAAGVYSVGAFSLPPSPYGPWHAHLDAAIRTLEAEVGTDSQATNSVGQLARLSLLYLVSGRREDALRMLPGSASAEADYWRRQVYALAVWLDEQREPDKPRRTAQTRLALEDAIARLADAAPLVVRNLVFCTEVQSYGCYKPVAASEFAPEQEVLLYAEIENFASEETPKGFYTKLRSSYQLFDARGQAVAEYDGTVTEDYCRNRRRDFFNCYHLRLPARIYPGKHTLRLTVEDMIGQKVGQSSIDFTIKEPAADTTARRRSLR